MSAPMAKVSFTVRRPTPVSMAESSGPESDPPSFKLRSIPRHLVATGSSTPSSVSRSATSSPRPGPSFAYDPNSSDEGDDDEAQDELVTGFDQFGVQRLREQPKPQGPLVIPALQNRDWRELARKRKNAGRFVPVTATVPTGADGSVGGLGTRDTVNMGSLKAGLHITNKVKRETDMDVAIENDAAVVATTKTEEPENEDQKAIRALLATAEGVDDPDGPIIDFIPPVTETDAYHQDMDELPSEATPADYARVPVSQFGAALLRGMGWTEGTAASRIRSGPVAPYLPAARPPLLGIGAKEWEVPDDGSQRKGGAKPERRYVPVMKKEKESSKREGRSDSGTPVDSGRNSRRRTPSPHRASAPASRHASQPSSRRTSRSPPHGDRHRDRERRHRDRQWEHGDASHKRPTERRDDSGYRRDNGDRMKERRGDDLGREADDDERYRRKV